MDDVKLEGQVQIVAADVQTIIGAPLKNTGLRLHPSKCEIVCFNFDVIKNYPVFDGFKKVEKEDLNLLGSQVLKGPAVDKALDNKVTELKSSIGRLSLLHAHDALCLLRNALAMPKLLHILRTAPCSNNPRKTFVATRSR